MVEKTQAPTTVKTKAPAPKKEGFFEGIVNDAGKRVENVKAI